MVLTTAVLDRGFNIILTIILSRKMMHYNRAELLDGTSPGVDHHAEHDLSLMLAIFS